ncbi:urease accessory protein UreF [Endozoicomonas arenosclerae]|uniref:urease accessory protein UreF n=1 Tax=Endozoicomonas arenosclerae TaxID=1633495 RepID=UPI000782B137|nr:urease accessory UreF family protein [Endozoicomonas arenosclerae]
MNTDALLGLLHISSPALPVGAFAYSQGLETAIDRQWCYDRESTCSWISELLTQGMGRLDVPAFYRLFDAFESEDRQTVEYWNNQLLAFRETRELYDEDCQVGKAFKTWLQSLYPEESRAQWLEKPTQAAMFALSCLCHGMDKETAAIGLLWSWCENQVAGATKAVPLGQTDAQKILQHLAHEIATVLASSKTIKDHEMGNNLVHYAMASSWHEHQYSRLFRS